MDVRLQALIALHRLQDPRESDDPVIMEYISAIYDSSPKVKITLLLIIAFFVNWLYLVHVLPKLHLKARQW